MARRRAAVLAVGLAAVGAALATGTPATADMRSAAGEDPGRLTDVESFLIERMHENKAPGLSYALVHDDEVVASGAWGTDGSGRPMTPRTPGGFGSVAKPITATAVLRLAGTGTVRLDDPVIDHLPWFRLADQEHAERITVRHLLEQTSGISSHDGYARSDLDDNAPDAIGRWVESLADVTPTAAPGERHQYSPANSTILAATIEEITGLSFSDYLWREVFTPLGMADGIADSRDAERMPPGHEYYFGTVRAADRTFDTSGLAYGYLAGSVTDLAHLAIPLLNNGRYGDARFLPKDMVTALRHGGPKATCGRYPLGWRTCTLKTVDTPIVWHTGAVTGYHSAVIAAPATGWAIAVQQNIWSPLHDQALNAAAFGALTIALGGTPAPTPATSTEAIALITLSTLVLLLAGALACSTRRLITHRPTPQPNRRTRLTTAGWAGLGILSTITVTWALPATFDLQLRHLVRYTPDIGQLSIAIAVLGPALTLTRLATLLTPIVMPKHEVGRRPDPP